MDNYFNYFNRSFLVTCQRIEEFYTYNMLDIHLMICFRSVYAKYLASVREKGISQNSIYSNTLPQSSTLIKFNI